jgi:hypothetical protein
VQLGTQLRAQERCIEPDALTHTRTFCSFNLDALTIKMLRCLKRSEA